MTTANAPTAPTRKPQTARCTARFVAPTPDRSARQPDAPMVGAGSLIARRPARDGKPAELVEALTIRTYYAQRGSGMQPVRACVWIRSTDGSEWLSGRGSAGGCGYHKESQAIADAISAAGVRLLGDPYMRDASRNAQPLDFGGTGSSHYATIFEAIAKARGFRGPFLWVSHGL